MSWDDSVEIELKCEKNSHWKIEKDEWSGGRSEDERRRRRDLKETLFLHNSLSHTFFFEGLQNLTMSFLSLSSSRTQLKRREKVKGKPASTTRVFEWVYI